MNEKSGSVTVEEAPRVVMVGETGLVVKRLRQSELNRCAAAAKLGDDYGSRALNAEFIIRAALANQANQGKQVKDSETGAPVRVRFAGHDLLGQIVTAEVYDALGDKAAAEIATLAQGGGLAEAAVGNSGAPLGGSTPSASGSGES